MHHLVLLLAGTTYRRVDRTVRTNLDNHLEHAAQQLRPMRKTTLSLCETEWKQLILTELPILENARDGLFQPACSGRRAKKHATTKGVKILLGNNRIPAYGHLIT
ncbi:Hypothetical protein PYTT_1979 [Akkermansia glycaniphila]|uniref:Uncharacterized protein n=1 Tax=Akkermansia glycaniphila TaxID=1679444 RepID=A0A1H6M765_9BACT|nr:Hypothetical protein PYTT_1979 [Akkermansia glycaniphila]